MRFCPIRCVLSCVRFGFEQKRAADDRSVLNLIVNCYPNYLSSLKYDNPSEVGG